MSAADNREPGAARLLTDILAGGQPDRELLIRYAKTPGSLSDAEREEVERLLAENPRYADRLRVLQSFSAAAALQDVERGLEQPVTVLRRAPARRARRLLLTALPLAAAVALAVLYGLSPSSTGNGPEGVQIVQSRPVTPAPADPEPLPRLGRGPAQPEPSPAPTGPELATPEPMPPAPQITPVPTPAPEPSLIAQVTKPKKPAGEPAPKPAEPETVVAEAKPEPAPEPEPEILVAMADLEYHVPGGMAERKRVSSTQRGGAVQTVVTTVVPEHIALTSRAQPSLFWHLDVLPDASLPFIFTLVDESSLDTLKSVELPRPEAPGLQRIDLAEYGIELEPGPEYRWTVALRLDHDQRSLDRLSQGWIRRVEVVENRELRQPVLRTGPDGRSTLDASTLSKLQGDGPAEAASRAASGGLWYDALAEVMDVRRSQPDNASADRALRQLLEQAGLASIAP